MWEETVVFTYVAIPTFSYRKRGKPRRASVTVASFRAEIFLCDLPNAELKFEQLK